MAALSTPSRLLLCVHDLGKRYGVNQVLSGVGLELDRGQVLALIGENGAGKSTLVKILSGVVAGDAGSVELDGVPWRPDGPLAARRAGVVMIHQELSLAPHLTVAANILLGAEPHRLGFLCRGAARALAQQALDRLGVSDLDLDAPAARLGLAQQQWVELARALVVEPKLLILDEPTAALGAADTEKLHAVIRRLRNQGVAVILISHHLEECRQLADHYVVLRDGQRVAAGAMAGVAEAELIRHMTGRAVDELYPRHRGLRGEALLTVRGLSGPRLPREASCVVHAGQVLGIYGLMGSGRTELLRTIMGLDRPRGGQVLAAGKDLTGRGPAACWRAGIGMVSEDRKQEGLLLVRDLADNLTLPALGAYRRGPLLTATAQARATASWIERLGVRCRGPRQTMGELSGGNQQKIAVARLPHAGCRVLLLDEPTRGIDVAAKARIYSLIAELAEAGCGVLIVSSHLPELLGISDELAVMRQGRLGPMRPVAAWSEAEVLAEALGAQESQI